MYAGQCPWRRGCQLGSVNAGSVCPTEDMNKHVLRCRVDAAELSASPPRVEPPLCGIEPPDSASAEFGDAQAVAWMRFQETHDDLARTGQ